eukprot:14545312-Ditylum_brightwellii.AAC.1
MGRRRNFYLCTKHNDEDEDVLDDGVNSVSEDGWEDEGILMTSREPIDVDGDLLDDDGNSNNEVISNVGDGRARIVVKTFTPTWPSTIIRVQCINNGYGTPLHVWNMELLDFKYDASCILFLSSVVNVLHDVREFIANKGVEKRGKKDKDNPYVYRPNQN